jgi:hypothetical protein
MFVWELVAQRLRGDGWHVTHRTARGAEGLTYVVQLQRRGSACRATGPTLTEAFAEAARRARQEARPSRVEPGPHFGASAVASR